MIIKISILDAATNKLIIEEKVKVSQEGEISNAIASVIDEARNRGAEPFGYSIKVDTVQ